MATLILNPNAPGDVTTIPDLTPGAGEANWEDVDDWPAPDEGTTTVSDTCAPVNSFSSYDLYAIPNHTIETGVINWVKVHARCQVFFGAAPGDAYTYTKIKTIGVEYNGAQNRDLAWATRNTQYNNHPAGGAWTWAQIDALQPGVGLNGHGDDDKLGASATCTQVYIEVDYTPGAAAVGAASGNIGHKMIGEGLI